MPDFIAGVFPYFLVAFVLIAVFVGFAAIRAGVNQRAWAISDALSEEVETTCLDADGKPVLDAKGEPLKATTLKASSSRLIALVGMIAILVIYVGFGSVILRDYATKGVVSGDIEKLLWFLVSGGTLFAPYLVNKTSAAFSSMFGGK